MDQKWFVSSFFVVGLCFFNLSNSLYLDSDGFVVGSGGANNEIWDQKGGEFDVKRESDLSLDKLNETQTEQPLSDGRIGGTLWLKVLTFDKLSNLTEKDEGPQNETKIIFMNTEDHLRIYENGNEESEDDAQLQEAGEKSFFQMLSPEGFLSHLIPESQSNALVRSKRQAEEEDKKCKCRKRRRKTVVRRRRRRRRRRYGAGQQNQPGRQRRRRRGRGRRRGTRVRKVRRGRRRCVCKKGGDGEGKSEGGEPEVEEADGGEGGEGAGEGEGEGNANEGGEGGEGGEGDEGGGEEMGEGEGGGEGGDEGEGNGEEGGDDGGGEGGEGSDEGGDEGSEDESDEGEDENEGSDEESDEQGSREKGSHGHTAEMVAPVGSMSEYPSVPPYPGVPRPAHPEGMEVPIVVIPAGSMPTRPAPTYTVVTYPSGGSLVQGKSIPQVHN